MPIFSQPERICVIWITRAATRRGQRWTPLPDVPWDGVTTVERALRAVGASILPALTCSQKR